MLSLQFNRTVEYALRAMAHLAIQAPHHPIPARALAEGTGIPQAYLSKIMKRMVEAGLVTSQKGHGGGFLLSRPRQKIRYLEILRASGYESEENRCVFGWGVCNSSQPCPLHRSWVDLNDAFKDWAAHKTLADVEQVPPRRLG